MARARVQIVCSGPANVCNFREIRVQAAQMCANVLISRAGRASEGQMCAVLTCKWVPFRRNTHSDNLNVRISRTGRAPFSRNTHFDSADVRISRAGKAPFSRNTHFDSADVRISRAGRASELQKCAVLENYASRREARRVRCRRVLRMSGRLLLRITNDFRSVCGAGSRCPG